MSQALPGARSPAPAGAVHVVVPDCIDDSHRPSGGNTYDRRICLGLRLAGWDVQLHLAPGSWPRPDASAQQWLAQSIAGIPSGQLVMVDGLIASTVPEILVHESQRLTLIVLVHMPLGDCSRSEASAHERAVLSAADAVITTSLWTQDWLVRRYQLRPQKIHVAEPGAEPAHIARGTTGGGQLICVGAITPLKGHDLLLTALASIADLSWRCVCVGPLDRDPGFVKLLRRRAEDDGLSNRLFFSGPRTGPELDQHYRAADALVLASRRETYGMVVTEALARGLPVVATNVGGVPEAMGRVTGGNRPGLLVQPDDPKSLAGALRSWLLEESLRQQLRLAARERRTTLSDWAITTDLIARVLIKAAG